VAEDVPEIGVKAGVPLPKSPGAVSKGARGCACSSDRGAEGAAGALALSAVVGMLVIRRRRRN
jgi:MYXO-CTERM domain-containing protein